MATPAYRQLVIPVCTFCNKFCATKFVIYTKKRDTLKNKLRNTNMELIELFIDNFNGLAFIKQPNNEIAYCNQKYKVFLKEINHELTSPKNNLLIEANLNFCRYVEMKCTETQSPVLALETFNGDKYITLRLPVHYKNTMSTLTLISLNACDMINEDKSNLIQVNSISQQ